MRLAALFVPTALVALILQSEVGGWLGGRLMVPDLVVILAVDLGLRHHELAAPIIAFAIGYATDALSGTSLGMNALTLTGVFLLSYAVSRSLITVNIVVALALVFGAVIVRDLANLLIGSGPIAMADAGVIMPKILWQAALTMVLAPAVFAMLRKLKRGIGLPVRGQRE